MKWTNRREINEQVERVRMICRIATVRIRLNVWVKRCRAPLCVETKVKTCGCRKMCTSVSTITICFFVLLWAFYQATCFFVIKCILNLSLLRNREIITGSQRICEVVRDNISPFSWFLWRTFSHLGLQTDISEIVNKGLTTFLDYFLSKMYKNLFKL